MDNSPQTRVNRLFPLFFWLLSLVISALFLFCIVHATSVGDTTAKGIIGMISFLIYAGLIWSLPAFLLMVSVFFILKARGVQPKQIKRILIGVALLAVVVSFTLLLESDLFKLRNAAFVSAYCAGTLVAGAICRIEKREKRMLPANP